MISVAIDGPAGAGKSTIARAAAAAFGFRYVDTGAIYRTIALAVSLSGTDPGDKAAVISLLPGLNIDMCYSASGEQCMYLNGEDVSKSIRQPEISMLSSTVSAIPEVRQFLTEMQRSMARKYDVIMDGRDIGTVILPDADLKIFLTASARERARRRFIQSGGESFESVLADIIRRDEQDTKRAAAPLKPAVDAVILDTSDMSEKTATDEVCRLITAKTGAVPKAGA